MLEKECTGIYDSKQKYQVTCSPEKCSLTSTFNYTCGVGRCAVNKTICDEYLNMEIFTNSLIFKISLRPGMSSNNVKSVTNKLVNNFHLVKSQVRTCPKIKHTWRADDACINGKTCFKKKRLNTKFTDLKLLSRYTLINTECPCKRNQHRYKCGDFCTTNKRVCIAMTLKKIQRSKATSLGMKSCGNSFILFDEEKV